MAPLASPPVSPLDTVVVERIVAAALSIAQRAHSLRSTPEFLGHLVDNFRMNTPLDARDPHFGIHGPVRDFDEVVS